MKARRPARGGPEWWALYAVAFVQRFESHVDSHGFDAASEMRSCHAEHAASVADEGLSGFEEAVAAGAIRRRR